MHLHYFDPIDTHPTLLINQDDERRWLLEALETFLSLPDRTRGKTWTIIGEKGMGKSILTRAVLQEIREKYSSDTLVVEVNCRHQQSWREILAEFTANLSREIKELNETLKKFSGEEISRELIATADTAATLASFDDAEAKEIHEYLTRFKMATRLEGEKKFLTSIRTDFSIELEREEKTIKALTGRIRIDERKLNRAICALCTDIRKAGFRIVAYLDNIDELDHRYNTAQQRDAVRHDVEGVLKLCRAPIALVLNMRTYFSSILRREAGDTQSMQRLQAQDLWNVLHRRMDSEPPHLRALYQQETCQKAIETLVQRSPTPLSFLVLFYFLFQHEFLQTNDLQEGFFLYMKNNYATIPISDINRIMSAFPTPGSEISHDDLTKTCGSETLLNQAQGLQIVLPMDFWNPLHFTLDPVFQIMHPSHSRR